MPVDIAVKIAFYIEEWATVAAFLEALRPAEALGPLEHLYQLHLLQWDEGDLWPDLDLTKMDEVSRIHVEAIAKFFSQVDVDGETDVHWVRQYVDPNAAIYWKQSSDGKYIHPETLIAWKDLRINAFDSAIIDPSKFTETLAYLWQGRLGKIQS
ncbi:hypothetical protein AC1031_011381 [Aphanomyces cochlioides]|nr:hypothetical protein AC1031_011381 [Aphanomyces cochlioides]